MPTEFEDVKYQVAVANRVLSEMGLTTGATASSGPRQHENALRLGQVRDQGPGLQDRRLIPGLARGNGRL